MSKPKDRSMTARPSRRDFLKTSAAVAGGAVVGGLTVARGAHAAGSDVLKLGLVGCGGRGTGAAVNAMTADENTQLAAVADPFPEKMAGTIGAVKQRFGDRVTADEGTSFDGFGGYQKLIDSGVDVVLLATPPHFRPIHLEAAVKANKHIFCEKPVAVDAPGVRSVLATCEAAKEKNLTIVSGLCWRYHNGVKATMQKVLDGAIGRIITIQETYLTGTLWHRGRAEDDTEMKYQVRNWYYFTWLSGDHNVEQHVHSLDKALWANGDEPPVRAWGMGGRLLRTEPKWGDIYDHHAVAYEFPETMVYSYCRQQDGPTRTYKDVSDHFYGTKGHANILRHKIDGENEWSFDGDGGNMYELEHQAMFAAIRSGQTINNGLYMARSTMLAIMGRMVNYTGQALTWEQALNSEEKLAPSEYSWDATPPTVPGEDGAYPVAKPGQKLFV